MSLNFIISWKNDKWYNKRVLIWRFTLVLIKINYGRIGDQKGSFIKQTQIIMGLHIFYPWYIKSSRRQSKVDVKFRQQLASNESPADGELVNNYTTDVTRAWTQDYSTDGELVNKYTTDVVFQFSV